MPFRVGVADAPLNLFFFSSPFFCYRPLARKGRRHLDEAKLAVFLEYFCLTAFYLKPSVQPRLESCKLIQKNVDSNIGAFNI